MYGNISDKNSATIKISEKMLTDTCNGIFVAQILFDMYMYSTYK